MMKKKKKIKKKKSSSVKEWSFADHTYKPKINTKLLATSNLKERKFVGATTKKGEAYGPVQASGTSSAVSGLASGYGALAYGLYAYGESIEALKANFSKFVNELPPDNTNLIPTLMEGYNKIFQNIASVGNVIMLGFQPSFIDNIKFNVDDLVDNLNSFNGNIMSVFLGEESGFEPIEIIVDWYESIGMSEDIISRIIFVEKTNSVFDDVDKITSDVQILSNNEVSGNEQEYHYFIADSIDSYSDLLQWDEVSLLGCIDPYLLAETMFVLNKKEYSYEIDTNYIYSHLSNSSILCT